VVIAAIPADWLTPRWPVPSSVRAVCTTRAGGVSGGAYASLNLGTHVGDAPDAVAANRALLGDGISARPVFLDQVHGTEVALLDATTPDGIEADACVTSTHGIACTVMVADCLPVLFASACGTRVAAAHAGWRGLAAGVLERALEHLDVAGGQPPSAWLGPCIGPLAFEVGDEVRAAFIEQSAHAAACFRTADRPGKWLADLPALARQRLRAAGVEHVHGNDGGDTWCTVRNPLRFFSHRRDRVGGRFAASVWIDDGIG
jgi:YfiH family protein